MTVVRDSVLEVDELPRKRATRMIINTAPPATQTQGEVYHSEVVVVVVVVLDFSDTPSFEVCDHAMICIKVKKAKNKNL